MVIILCVIVSGSGWECVVFHSSVCGSVWSCVVVQGRVCGSVQ